jgi:iron-sulfur cluster repair protein YtfE (RIC family)
MEYIGIKYPQRSQVFEPYLSIIDMLFYCGKDKTVDILKDRNNYKVSKINQKLED